MTVSWDFWCVCAWWYFGENLYCFQSSIVCLIELKICGKKQLKASLFLPSMTNPSQVFSSVVACVCTFEFKDKKDCYA